MQLGKRYQLSNGKITQACRKDAFYRRIGRTGQHGAHDGFAAYLGMDGYVHQRQVQTEQPEAEHVLPRVHLVIGLLKRWMLGTHQGAIGNAYLDDYLNEFTFRSNRRTSKSRGKLFYRLAQQAVQIDPVPLTKLVKPQPVGLGGVK